MLPIAIRGAVKTYGGVRALDNVDLDIRAGEFLTLLGPSGSGKTTLLMILAGFIRPDGGSVRFGDEEMILTPPHKRGVGMVFQNYALFPHMDVAANIGYPLKLRRTPADVVRQKVAEALAMVRLEGLGGRRVEQLSGGQKQRVALARAIVFAPNIVLMDEPLSALDKKLREEMQGEIRALHEQLGMTTVYVTHDQREALTMSDRVAVINNGALAQLDSPRRLYERPATAFVADFIGESTLLPAQVKNGRAFCGGMPVAVAELPPADGDYLLMMRPEHLLLQTADGDADGGGEEEGNMFAAEIRHLSYQGESVLVRALLAGGEEALSRQPAHRCAGLSPKTKVVLRLPKEHAVLVAADSA